LGLSDEELKKGVELCFNNVTSLVEDAETLLKRRSYGHATFLALCAIEETAKAYMYALSRTETWKPDELRHDVVRHDSKYIVFLFSLVNDILQKRIEKGQTQTINKPLDVDDFVQIGKDWDSAIGDMMTLRNRSLYVDCLKGEWSSPSDIKQGDAESWIELARTKKEEFGTLCTHLLSPPIDFMKAVHEWVDGRLMPSMIEHLRRNAQELYERKLITKKLYDVIMSDEKKKDIC
jgi:AbiV family abortive infection protein